MLGPLVAEHTAGLVYRCQSGLKAHIPKRLVHLEPCRSCPDHHRSRFPGLAFKCGSKQNSCSQTHCDCSWWKAVLCGCSPTACGTLVANERPHSASGIPQRGESQWRERAHLSPTAAADGEKHHLECQSRVADFSRHVDTEGHDTMTRRFILGASPPVSVRTSRRARGDPSRLSAHMGRFV